MAKIKLVSKDGNHSVELDDKTEKAEINRFRFGLGYREAKAKKDTAK